MRIHLIMAIAFFSSGMASAEEKLKFEKYIQALKSPELITQFYKKRADVVATASSPEVLQLIEKNQGTLIALENDFKNSRSFERGAIELESNLNGVTQLLQLDLLRASLLATKNQWSDVQNIFSAWFQFAADFPFEESSLIGLRFAGVLRSLLLDDLENIQKNHSSELAKNSDFRKWLLRIKAPWPVDRVVISEARRILKPPYQSLAQKVAKAYQKNPYQSAAASLKGGKGKDSEGAQVLREFWRDSDIEAMKTEVTRISKLKLRMASAEFEWLQKRKAQNVDELVQKGLLERVPIDYFTGRPLDLTSL